MISQLHTTMSGWASQHVVVPDTPLSFQPAASFGALSPSSAHDSVEVVPETPMHGRMRKATGEEFCTKENFLNSVAFINQDLELLGFPCILVQSMKTSDLDPIELINRLKDVLTIYHKIVGLKEDLVLRNHRLSCDLDHQQSSYKRLKRNKEQVEKEVHQEREKLRQLNIKYKTLSGQVKTDVEEMRKLTAVQTSKDNQYKHEMKKKEKELNKLKERLHQLIADKAPDRKVGMDIMSLVGGSDGRRATWKTIPGKQEEEMYQVVVSHYEESRQELMQENAELRDCLLSLQRELSSLLKQTGDLSMSSIAEMSNFSQSNSSIDHEEEQESCSSRLSITDLEDGYFQMPCDMMRSQIQQMFKDTCEQISQSMKRSLIKNVGKISSSSRRGSMSSFSNFSDNATPERKTSIAESSEVDRLRKQITNYKAIIQQQEDLIQQTLSSHSSSLEGSFFNESQLHKEKDNLSEQRKLFAEEKSNFEKERKKFTEAAIRLAKEKKAFDSERASFLKQQFLSLSPFRGTEGKKSKSEGPSNRLLPATPVFSPAKSDLKSDASLPTTSELFKALGFTKRDDSIVERSPHLQEHFTAHRRDSTSHISPHSGTHNAGASSGNLIATASPTTLSVSPHDSSGDLSNSFSPRIEAIKASLMKKHLERSKSKD